MTRIGRQHRMNRLHRGHRRPGGNEAARLRREGNTVKTERYDITIEKDRVKVRDRTNDTEFDVWGDPHVWTGDGDKLGFTRDNLTVELKDGTKLTFQPTEADANGVSFVDQVAIMNRESAILVEDVHAATGPTFGGITEDSHAVDDLHDDGTVLRVGDEADDLYSVATGEEFVGIDEGSRFDEFQLDGLGGESSLQFGFDEVLEELEQMLDTPVQVPAGGDLYSRMFAVMQRIDSQLENIVSELEQLQQEKELDGVKQKKRDRQIDDIQGDKAEIREEIVDLKGRLAELEELEELTPEQEEEKRTLKAQIGEKRADIKKLEGDAELIDGKAERGTTLESRMQRLSFEMQRLEGLKNQIGSMMSTLLANSNSLNREIIRNIQAR